ncbi:polysaccharide lyase [Sulfitobacter sp.]|nr:polysaccharide lyase [bacterium]MDC0136890.1 polysaccharide lyase [Sulfitobacter sp.]
MKYSCQTLKILLISIFFVTGSCVFANEGKPIFVKKTPMARWGYSKSIDVVRAGKKSERFEVRHGDCFQISSDWNDCTMDRERAELSGNSGKKFSGKSSIWFGWSVYVPKDFVMSDKMLTFAGQLHRSGGPVFGSGKSKSLPPLFAFVFAKNSAGLCIFNKVKKDGLGCNYIIYTKNVSKDMEGRWNDVQVNFDNTISGGEISLYVNNKKVGTKKDAVTHKASYYYFKYGIYRSGLKNHLSAYGVPLGTQILYFDELRYGDSRESVMVDEGRPLN